MTETSSTDPAPLSFGTVVASFGAWCRREPLAALLVVGLLGVLTYFFGFLRIFINGAHSAAVWASQSWNTENNQEHGFLILPAALFVLWYHRQAIRDAVKAPSNWGLLPLLSGILCFLLAVRCLQPRLAVVALPLIIYGSVYFLYGKRVARIFAFPCAFMLFMVPVGGLVQGTVSLQLLVSQVCNALSQVIGVKIEATGTTIRSLDGGFNFEIAEGCSGIRSLMAMTTLTALYVHFTQDQLWKKGVIFAGSIVFAVIGNIGRIFTVILVAKFIDPNLAAGIYHDYSGFIFFPVAVSTMVAFSNLVNRDWTKVFGGLAAREPRAGGDATPKVAVAGKTTRGPISYDY